MSENTKIEWADHTFNPWVGCTKISPACDHCYAEGWAKRSGQVMWGSERKRTSVANWNLPLKWNKQAALMQSAWSHGVALHGGDEAACIAAGHIKPVRPKVFCASLADVFDNEVPASWRADLFELIHKTPNLDWLLLTKRIGNAASMIEDANIAMTRRFAPCAMESTYPWPWKNVWLGSTICNQAEADRDIPKLELVPAAVRFLSIEPMLGPIDLQLMQYHDSDDRDEQGRIIANTRRRWLRWVIVGGESGPNARPMHPDWARSLRDQCQVAGVPFLFKQWGEWIPADQSAVAREANGFSPIKEFLHLENHHMHRVGKKAAGRLLDGREWNGVPA